VDRSLTIGTVALTVAMYVLYLALSSASPRPAGAQSPTPAPCATDAVLAARLATAEARLEACRRHGEASYNAAWTAEARRLVAGTALADAATAVSAAFTALAPEPTSTAPAAGTNPPDASGAPGAYLPTVTR
jgi:hypothetical protein